MTAKVAQRLWNRPKTLGVPTAVYDLAVPFNGHNRLAIILRHGCNWIYAVNERGRLTAIGNHPGVTDPDETIRELGYFVRRA